jgi:hypothetical protein
LARIERLTVGAAPDAWRGAGFAVGERGTKVGRVQIDFHPGEGVLGWRLDGADSPEVDGLPVAPPTSGDEDPGEHPNGATHIDHVVVLTPDLERTTAALAEIGVERRRVREGETDDGLLRQGFFRFGELILEVVEHARIDPGPARFWGITFAIADLDACATLLGDSLGSIRDAHQPGHRIATVRASAGLGLPVVVISANGNA